LSTKKPVKKAKKAPAKKAKKSVAKKSTAKKTVKKSAAKKRPAKKTAAKKSPAKKTAAKKSPAKKKSSTKVSTRAPKKAVAPQYDDLLQKIIDKTSKWAKSLFDEEAIRETVKNAGKRAEKFQAQVKNKTRVDEDDFLRDLLNSNPELLSWTSVSTVTVDGKKGTSTRKWLLLYSNGEVAFVNRGTSRSPEAVITKSRKNVKHITNARASIKSVKLEKYKLTLGQVASKEIVIKLDPAVASNAETAKKFVTKIKKFI
jgi:hypothetical protein